MDHIQSGLWWTWCSIKGIMIVLIIFWWTYCSVFISEIHLSFLKNTSVDIQNTDQLRVISRLSNLSLIFLFNINWINFWDTGIIWLGSWSFDFRWGYCIHFDFQLLWLIIDHRLWNGWGCPWFYARSTAKILSRNLII